MANISHRVLIRHEFEPGGASGSGVVAQISANNVAFLEGLERMFAINQNERITGVEIVSEGKNNLSIKAYIARK